MLIVRGYVNNNIYKQPTNLHVHFDVSIRKSKDKLCYRSPVDSTYFLSHFTCIFTRLDHLYLLQLDVIDTHIHLYMRTKFGGLIEVEWINLALGQVKVLF